MAIFPLPPGLAARLNIPPTYQTATEDTAPPAYIAPLNRISTFRPESIPLPPSPAPAPSTQQIPPPEYSPSVYSQQRLSHHLPDPDPAALGFPSSPRRPSAGKVEQQHAGHFKESWTDLSMRVDLEAGREGPKGEPGKRSVFRLYPPVKEGEVERLYWKRAVVALGISMVVAVVVVVAVCVSLRGRRS